MAVQKEPGVSLFSSTKKQRGTADWPQGESTRTKKDYSCFGLKRPLDDKIRNTVGIFYIHSIPVFVFVLFSRIVTKFLLMNLNFASFK